MTEQPIILLVDSRQIGGIETHVYQLCKALLKHGWSAEIWFYQEFQTSHPLKPLLLQHNIPFRFLKGSLYCLYSELKSAQPLLIHTHGYKAGVFGRISALLNKTPTVSTFHNGDPGEGLVRLYTWLDELTSPLSVNIGVSEEICKRNIHSIAHISNFIATTNTPLTSSCGQYIAFVGRLSYEKGPDLFLQLAKHQPNLPFRLYGTGPMEISLREQQVANVEFMGQAQNMDEHWHNIGLLCITSRFEALPLVALEAMANGIPVVSFPLGGLPSLINQGFNGWISDMGDLVAMSNILQLWHALPERVRQQLSKACRATISNHYSDDAILPEILTIYKQSVRSKGQHWPRLDIDTKK